MFLLTAEAQGEGPGRVGGYAVGRVGPGPLRRAGLWEAEGGPPLEVVPWGTGTVWGRAVGNPG